MNSIASMIMSKLGIKRVFAAIEEHEFDIAFRKRQPQYEAHRKRMLAVRIGEEIAENNESHSINQIPLTKVIKNVPQSTGIIMTKMESIVMSPLAFDTFLREFEEEIRADERMKYSIDWRSVLNK